MLAAATGSRDALCDEFADAGLRAPVRIGAVVGDPEVRLLRGVRCHASAGTHRLG